MRPDREEILAGVRRALAEFVAPEVTSVYGRTQLAYAMNLVTALAREGDEAIARLVDENLALRRLLRQAGTRLGGSSLSVALVEELRSWPPAGRTSAVRPSAIRAENARLFEAFVRLQAACEDAPGGDVAVRRTYRETLKFLRARASL